MKEFSGRANIFIGIFGFFFDTNVATWLVSYFLFEVKIFLILHVLIGDRDNRIH